MADVISGQRAGPFVIFRDGDGRRHAVRQGNILSVSDGDETGDTVVVTFSGQRTATVLKSFEEVMTWLA